MSVEVLVVDDEADLASLYAAWLDAEYEVTTATSGGEALDEIDDGTDVVLLDRRMPELSGDEVLAAIRDRDIDCRVAMVTAVNPEFDVIEMGFDDYLLKPVDREELLATVDRLDRRSEYDEKLQEYFSLVSRRATLKREKTADELASSEQFGELEARIDALRADLDELIEGFEEEDYSATLRDVAADAGPSRGRS
ncbi:MAG: HalX domain-containing protein [Halobacteriaceae archaeon]